MLIFSTYQARYFVDEVKDKSNRDVDVSSWKQEFVGELPEQENGYVCSLSHSSSFFTILWISWIWSCNCNVATTVILCPYCETCAKSIMALQVLSLFDHFLMASSLQSSVLLSLFKLALKCNWVYSLATHGWSALMLWHTQSYAAAAFLCIYLYLI